MADLYGSDFITITDEAGNDYELEVLTSVEFNGFTYLAVIPADDSQSNEDNFQVSILKSVEEDGEPILCGIEDDTEMESVYQLIMDLLFEEQE